MGGGMSCPMREGGKHRYGAITRSEENGQPVRFCTYCTTPQAGSRIPREQRHWFEVLEQQKKEGRA